MGIWIIKRDSLPDDRSVVMISAQHYLRRSVQHTPSISLGTSTQSASYSVIAKGYQSLIVVYRLFKDESTDLFHKGVTIMSRDCLNDQMGQYLTLHVCSFVWVRSLYRHDRQCNGAIAICIKLVVPLLLNLKAHFNQLGYHTAVM